MLSACHLFWLTPLFAPLILFGKPAVAAEEAEPESPFKVESFDPKKSRYTINGGFGFISSESTRPGVATISIPVGHDYWVPIPIVATDIRQSDSIFARASVRYALREGTNLSLGFRADGGRAISTKPGENRAEYSYGWRNLTIGFDSRLGSPFSNPLTIIFTELSIADRGGRNTGQVNAATLGISGHWAFDPVIASLNAAYTYVGSRSRTDGSYRPSDVASLGGAVGLVMNPEITLRAGVSQAFRIGHRTEGIGRAWSSVAALTLGYTQRLSTRTVITVDAQAAVTGGDGAQISAGFVWRP